MFDHYDRHDYFRCVDCGCVFLHPMPDPATIATFYPAHYSVFDEGSRTSRVSPLKQALLKRTRGYTHLHPPAPYPWLATMLAPLHKSGAPAYVPQGKLLDVGCGNGRYLYTMRMLGWDVQGVELSEDGVRACRASQLPVHHGDLQSASFPDAGFDVITVRHVIEHIREPHALMTELARILKPGGRLIIETPNSEALGRALMGANWFHNDVPRHLILYSPDNLAKLAALHGLDALEIRLETTPKSILNSIDYALHNTGKPSSRIRWRRMLSRLYLWCARWIRRGDTIIATSTKR